MSAYVVDRDHVRYLVEAVGRVGRHPFSFSFWSKGKGTRVAVGRGKDMSPDEFGQMLWDENIRSVEDRYSGSSSLPGSVGETYEHPLLQGWVVMDPVAVLKACQCYEYQSCEHAGWEESDAYQAIRALRGAAISSLPGYEDAEWGSPARAS